MHAGILYIYQNIKCERKNLSNKMQCNELYTMFIMLFFQAGLLAESLFRVFDADKSGNLDFFEFVQANSVKNLNTPEDKLGWMFDAFDADGGGTVDGDEITNIVVGLFRLGGIEEDEDLLAACVFDVIEAVDQEGDGDISKEEFVKNAMKCKFIFNMLKSKRG